MSNMESNNVSEVVVEEPAKDEAGFAEAYYWVTITDFVQLCFDHGLEKVMHDFKRVCVDRSRAIAKEHPIIVP